MKTIARLLASDFLTAEEKVNVEKMKQAGHKGDFEQESLGKPSADWPYYGQHAPFPTDGCMVRNTVSDNPTLTREGKGSKILPQ